MSVSSSVHRLARRTSGIGLRTLLPGAALGFVACSPSVANAGPAVQPEGRWYEKVIAVTAAGQPIDTATAQPDSDGVWFDEEQLGHAAPEFFDWDGDGLQDLLVGGFSGRFRLYLNSGTAGEPRFTDYEWIQAGEDVAVVQNFCCVAVRPQMADIDGDGDTDLTAGSYAPGLIYWFGSTSGGLRPWRALTDRDGVPIMARLDTLTSDTTGSFASKPAWMDWDADGDLDLIIGNLHGDLVLRYNEGQGRKDGITGVPHQPVFSKHTQFPGPQFSVFDYVRGGAGALEAEKYLTPEAVDWDQDGLVDIVVGTQSGAVYWLRNIGDEGEPRFEAPEQLLPPVEGGGYPPIVLLEKGEPVPRGARVSVDVVDYNGDGKVDLIVGDWSRTTSLRSDLTDTEREAFERLSQALIDLDRRARIAGPGLPFRDRLRSTPAYRDAGRGSELWAEKQALEGEALAYLEPVRDGHRDSMFAYTRFHGRVWVYIRK